MAPVLEKFDHGSVDGLAPALADLYAEVYAEPPYCEGPEDVRNFRVRFVEHRREPAFRLVAAFDGDRLTGYLYGFRVDVESPEWDRLLIRAVDTGSGPPLRRPTAYVSELLVHADFRRRGLARRLHDTFLSERREDQAALLAHPDATAAQAAYSAWGWKRVGYGRPFPDAPEYETLMLFL